MTLTGLVGKVAVVTGAGRMRSLGREIAVALAQAGCDVVITGTGRPRDRLPADEQAAGWRDIDSVADEIRALGRRALPVVADVTDEAAIEALADTVVVEFGRVDILVNNAGAPIGPDRRPVVELGADAWRRVLDINLTGTFLMSRTFGRLLVEAGAGGSIVNISSIAGKLMPPNSAAYAASKAGVHALTACMAQEVGSARVRVNAICPGYIATSRLDGLRHDPAWQSAVARIPLGLGSPADVSSTVLFLCSDEGAWITGQAWNVDGGHVVQH
jgi:NAD(P)-dependent dehydrogenase (short-subunit alcohol dehydrogenase family)